MPKLIALLVLLVFVSPILSKLVIIVDFQFNRSYIVENLCVNRDEPAVMCYGQCVLSEKLSLQEQKNDLNILQANQQVREVPQWYWEDTSPETIWVVHQRPARIFPNRSRKHYPPVLPAVFHPPEAQPDQL